MNSAIIIISDPTINRDQTTESLKNRKKLSPVKCLKEVLIEIQHMKFYLEIFSV